MMQADGKSMRSWFFALVFCAALALVPADPAAAQTRVLPDFTDLVEQVGPSVVNIRTLEKATARSRSGNGVDEEMLERFQQEGSETAPCLVGELEEFLFQQAGEEFLS